MTKNTASKTIDMSGAPRLGLSGRLAHLRAGSSGVASVRMTVEHAEKVRSARLDVPVLDETGQVVRPSVNLKWDEKTRTIRGWSVEWPQTRAA